MNPSTGELKTRLPQPWTSYKPDAFKPCRRPLPFGGIERKKCINCGYRYIPDLNAPANCKHSGGWHSTFGDCNYIKCGFGLKTDIGTFVPGIAAALDSYPSIQQALSTGAVASQQIRTPLAQRADCTQTVQRKKRTYDVDSTCEYRTKLCGWITITKQNNVTP